MCLEKFTRSSDVIAMKPREPPASDNIAVSCSRACGTRLPLAARTPPARVRNNVLACGGGTEPNQTAPKTISTKQANGMTHMVFA